MRAYTEGCRALGVWVARAARHAEHHRRPEATRRRADDFVALMTPIVKALFTDLGFEAANLGVQVYGGHGYIREQASSSMSAMPASRRSTKAPTASRRSISSAASCRPHAGRLLRSFFHPVSDFIEANKDDDGSSAEFVQPLAKAFGGCSRRRRGRAGRAERSRRRRARPRPIICACSAWSRSAYHVGAHGRDQPGRKGGDHDGFYAAKLVTARFYMQRMLPQTSGLFSSIMAGAKTMMAFEEAAF